MVVEHRAKGIIPISEIVVGDWIRYRSGWVRAADILHKMRRMWLKVILDCGEEIVVTPNHIWGTVEHGECATEFLYPGVHLPTDNGPGTILEIVALDEEALCVHITVDHPDHSYNIGSTKPVAITHNGRLAIS